MRILLAFVLLFASVISKAQSDIDALILRDDPYDISNVWIKAAPLYIGSLYEAEVDAGAALGFQYQWQNQVFFDVYAKLPYSPVVDGAKEAAEQDSARGDYVRGFEADIGLTWIISDTIKLKALNMFIGSGRNPERLYRTQSSLRKAWGIKAGYNYMSSVVSGNYLRLDRIQHASGTSLDNMPGRKFTNIRVRSFYLGLSQFTIRNFRIQTSDFGENEDFRFRRIFADMMVSPALLIDEVGYGYNSYDLSGDEYSERPFGFRVGIEEYLRFSDHVGFIASLETGIRPGLNHINSDNPVRNFYWQARLFLTLHDKW
ncbi:MAG: hypothetical protein WD077_05000 [Bacteroidia bacterium]